MQTVSNIQNKSPYDRSMSFIISPSFLHAQETSKSLILSPKKQISNVWTSHLGICFTATINPRLRNSAVSAKMETPRRKRADVAATASLGQVDLLTWMTRALCSQSFEEAYSLFSNIFSSVSRSYPTQPHTIATGHLCGCVIR